MTDLPIVKRSLYLKYRPQNFDSLIGQDPIRKILKSAAKEDKLSQGYLLIGPRGTGKTTTARLISKTLNCTNPKEGIPCEQCDSCEQIQEGRFLDVIEIDAASNTGVDDMRDLIEKAQFAPSMGKKKVYIIDEVHMLSKSAFNALLKTLEEPPRHVHFILATTEANKVPPTITSRCQRFDFKRISIQDIVKRLEYICKEEKISYDNKSLSILAGNCDGGMRDAISLLEQVAIDNQVTVESIEFSLGIVRGQIIEEFVNYLLEKKTNMALKLIDQIYQEGVNLTQFKKETLEYLRKRILDSLHEKESSEKIHRYLTLIESLNDTKVENAVIPQFPLELMICKLTLSEVKAFDGKKSEEKKTPEEKKTEPKPENQPEVKKPEPKVETQEAQEYTFTPDDLPNHKFTIKPTLEKIREDWRKIIDLIENSSLKYSLREAFLESFEKDILCLSFSTSFHYNKVKSSESIKSLENALEEYFKIPIKTKFSLSKIKVEKKEMPEEEIPPPIQNTEIKPEPKEEIQSSESAINIQQAQDLFNS